MNTIRGYTNTVGYSYILRDITFSHKWLASGTGHSVASLIHTQISTRKPAKLSHL